jgi:site-specific recombinase XerD
MKMDELVPAPESTMVPLDLLERARGYARESRASNTRNGYASDWKQFTSWCSVQGVEPLPASVETIATYITSMAESGKKTATIQRHLATIAAAHKAQGAADPTKNEAVRQVFAGIKRTHGSAQTGRLPLLTVDLRAMIQAIPQNLLGLRDRLILLLGYPG